VHIPDGYLSPQTCAVALAVAVPAIGVASAKVARQVRGRAVPQLAMLSAFSFLVMMFNLPVPGGTTAHAVGAVLIAVTMGLPAAVVATAVALLFQALFFGDGGLLAYGANVVNIALIMPLVGLVVFRAVAGRRASLPRRAAATALGGYAGIVAAGLAVGVELGIQPALFHDAAGVALYNPYPLAVTVPAMALAHLVVAGPAEAVLGAAGLTFLGRTGQLSQLPAHKARSGLLGNPGLVSLGVLAVMLLLTPLGLIAQGTAFGEWGVDDLAERLGGIPAGLATWSGWFGGAVLPDYALPDGGNPVLGYWISALVGSLLVAGFTFGMFWTLGRLRRARVQTE
jgi:cobalt/nickel transport system permease protein